MPHERILPVSKIALQDSSNGSPASSGKNSPVAHASVTHTDKARDWFLMLLVGALLAVSWTTYKENRILEMRVEGFERALLAHGIKNTYPHLPGEDD